jgi:hypothetical protein
MQRVFGILAIFGGWLCILLAVFFGLIATQFMGLDHIEGALPPNALYGIPAVMVMWVAIGVAILAAVPVGAAMFHKDPSNRLYVVAAVMGVLGVALIPDDLGRAYAVALIPGAALFAAGGWLIHEAGEINPDVIGTSTEVTWPAIPNPTPTPPPETWQWTAAPEAAPPVGAQSDAAPPVGALAAAPDAAPPADEVVAAASQPAEGPADPTGENVATGSAAPDALPTDATPRADETVAATSAPRLAESQGAESPLAESPLAESPSAESPSAESPSAESQAAESPSAEDAECPWCSAWVAVGADRCPSCGAALSSAAELAAVSIPGVTAVAPELAAYREKVAHHKKRQGILSMMLSEPDARLFVSTGEPTDADALRPPSAEVRAEMDRFDRELAAGSPSGDDAVSDVNATEPGPGAQPETAPQSAVAPEAPVAPPSAVARDAAATPEPAGQPAPAVAPDAAATGAPDAAAPRAPDATPES